MSPWGGKREALFFFAGTPWEDKNKNVDAATI
jgi:hypothetical protein